MQENKKSLDGMCESCMMPFRKDPLGENRESEKYCSYCFNNGKLCYEGNDVNEFKRAMVEAIVLRGEPRWKAKLFAFMSGFAPRWMREHSKRSKGQAFLGKIFGSYGQNCEDKK